MSDRPSQSELWATSPTDLLLCDKNGLRLPHYALSTAELRSAEVLQTERQFDTLDGKVSGQRGDVGVIGYAAEQWPVKREIFLGSYMIVGRVGDHLTAQRLIHPRLAWQVESDDATFDYQGRGRVSALRGGWLYQSDDGDFGYLNPGVKHQGHVEIGFCSDIDNCPWKQRVAVAFWTLLLLPPVLSLLALLAFLAQMREAYSLSRGLVFGELFLLIIGAILAFGMRKGHWISKSLVTESQRLALEFQVAIQLLGERTSKAFPAMALWRSAQQRLLPEGAPECKLVRDAAAEQALGLTIHRTHDAMQAAVQREHAIEQLAKWLTLAGFVAIVLCNLLLIFGLHMPNLEVGAIWLPAAIGCAHTLTFRRRSVERIAALKELVGILSFVKIHLYGADCVSDDSQRESILRLLCRAIALHGQKELRFALSTEPDIPV